MFMAGFGEALSKFGKSIVDGTKNTAKTVNLSVEIEELETKIKRLYLELGEKCYEICKDDPIPTIADLLSEITKLKEEIDSKKTERITLSGKKICPKCNSSVDHSSMFCPNCGNKFEEEKKEDAPAAAAAPAEKFCKTCGKKLSPDALFCGDCGTKA